MTVEIDDATINHALNMTCFLVVVMSFLGALLAQVFCVVLDLFAKRIVRYRQRKLIGQSSTNA